MKKGVVRGTGSMTRAQSKIYITYVAAAARWQGMSVTRVSRKCGKARDTTNCAKRLIQNPICRMRAGIARGLTGKSKDEYYNVIGKPTEFMFA